MTPLPASSGIGPNGSMRSCRTPSGSGGPVTAAPTLPGPRRCTYRARGGIGNTWRRQDDTSPCLSNSPSVRISMSSTHGKVYLDRFVTPPLKMLGRSSETSGGPDQFLVGRRVGAIGEKEGIFKPDADVAS